MSLSDIRALTFDKGSTILDWYGGFADALRATGSKHGLQRDWHSLSNDMRGKGLGKMLNLGKDTAPVYTFDGAHRMALDEVITEKGLDAFSEAERHAIAYDAPHNFECWPDFPPVLPKLREKYICASFTILSYRIIIDTARRNGLRCFPARLLESTKFCPRPTTRSHSICNWTRPKFAWSPAIISIWMRPKAGALKLPLSDVPMNGVQVARLIPNQIPSTILWLMTSPLWLLCRM